MYILSQVNKETIWGSRELIAYGADPALDKVGSCTPWRPTRS